MKRLIILSALFLTACGSLPKQADEVIYVSIAPLEYVVRQIADSGTQVKVLVPETTSPESYEPTVQQIKGLVDARAYISTGLIDFEQALETKIRDIAPNTVVVDLSENVDVLEGHCEHGAGEGHEHGIDPHIWLSPKIVHGMRTRIAELLTEFKPDSAAVYTARAELFGQRVDSLDGYIRKAVAGAKRNSFAIGHTSLTYFADDYGLNQIAVEDDGKEPSVRKMKLLVDSLQRLGIKAVFYQRQTSDAGARAVAAELPEGRTVEFDPLAPDWMRNMYRLADSLRVALND